MGGKKRWIRHSGEDESNKMATYMCLLDTWGRARLSFPAILPPQKPSEVAHLWGVRKRKPAMNYEKLSRALRWVQQLGDVTYWRWRATVCVWRHANNRFVVELCAAASGELLTAPSPSVVKPQNFNQFWVEFWRCQFCMGIIKNWL